MRRKTSGNNLSQNSKVHPKLRMVANCDTAVNAIRAEHASAIGIKDEAVLENIPCVRGNEATPVAKSRQRTLPEIEVLKDISSDSFVNVFIELDDAANVPEPLTGETARMGNLVTAHIPMSRLAEIAENEHVAFIELGDAMSLPRPVAMSDQVSAPSRSERRVPLGNKHKNSVGVLIGIIDVEGFDFAHPDFLDKYGNTRFFRI